MTIDTKDMLNSILSSISRIDYVRPDDIPNVHGSGYYLYGKRTGIQ